MLSLTTASIAVWIWVMTLQATLLNRQVVLDWLQNSGAYENVVDAVVNLDLNQDAGGTLSQDALKEAVGNTLTPSFVKQVSEASLNGTFDWLEGKTEKIEFSVPLADKRDDLQQQLAAVLAPELKDLPTCAAGFSGLSIDSTNCLPPGTSPEQAAATAAEQAVGSSDFLTEPITEDALGSEYMQYVDWLPSLVQNLGWLSVGLPIIAALSGTGYVFLSQHKLRGARTLFGTLLFSAGLSALAGIGLWFIGTNVQLEQAAGDDAFASALLGDVVQPVVSQILPSIGLWLAVFAGSAALLSAAAWITLLVVGRKRTQSELMTNDTTPKSDEPKPEPQAVQPNQKDGSSNEATAEAEKPTDPKPPTKTIGRL